MPASIQVVCSNSACGKSFRVKSELAGKRVKCPACKQLVRVQATPDEEDPAPANSSTRILGLLWPLATAVLGVLALLAVAWSIVASNQATSLKYQLQNAVDDADQKTLQTTKTLDQVRADLEKARADLRSRQSVIDKLNVQLDAAAKQYKGLEQTAAKQNDAIRDVEKKLREAETQIEALKKMLVEQVAQEKQALKRVETDSLDVEMKNFQGVWNVREVVDSFGMKWPSSKTDFVIISGDSLTREMGGMPHDVYTPFPFVIRLDPKKKPRTIDLTRPDFKLPVMQGIYAWEGNLLRIHCGGDRPGDFSEKLKLPKVRGGGLSLLLEKSRSKPLPPIPKTVVENLTSSYWEVVAHGYTGTPPIQTITVGADNTGVVTRTFERGGVITETRKPFSFDARPEGLTMIVPDNDPLKSQAWELTLSRDKSNLRLWDYYTEGLMRFERRKKR